MADFRQILYARELMTNSDSVALESNASTTDAAVVRSALYYTHSITSIDGAFDDGAGLIIEKSRTAKQSSVAPPNS